MQSFLEALNTRPMFFDGAMGTLLQSRGLSPGELPESWNITQSCATFTAPTAPPEPTFSWPTLSAPIATSWRTGRPALPS